MKVALVHDWLIHMRGGEKVLDALAELYPEATVYTLFYDRRRLSPRLAGLKIKASFLQYFPGIKRYYRWLLPILPWAIQSLKVEEADLVISSSHCVAKGIRVPEKAFHVCYCHTPMRYLWGFQEIYFSRYQSLLRHGIHAALYFLRKWDLGTNKRVDLFVANSDYIRKRIQSVYDREAVVVHPPLETDFFLPPQENLSFHKKGDLYSAPTPPLRHVEQSETSQSEILPGVCPARGGTRGQKDENRTASHGASVPSVEVPAEVGSKALAKSGTEQFYLAVSHFVPYKRLDLVIEAFNTLDRRLVIIGSGPLAAHYQKLRKSERISFLGSVDNEELRKAYAGARAFIFPTEEDFGIVPLEAQACGTPVIAFRKGGALETVRSGVFFDEQTPEAIREAVLRFESLKFERAEVSNKVQDFGRSHFLQQMKAAVRDRRTAGETRS